MPMTPSNPSPGIFPDLAVAVAGTPDAGAVTARVAGGLVDLRLPVSPGRVAVRTALMNMAKAINIALQSPFLPTELEPAYRAARVWKGRVEILHRDYIGLGDGVFATIGKAAKSFQLTLRGPDPASPEGRSHAEQSGARPMRGLLDLLGRKLNLLQEYEDQVPIYVEQMLDRLEAVCVVEGWTRDEWDITTTDIGLDVRMLPRPAGDASPRTLPRKTGSRSRSGRR